MLQHSEQQPEMVLVHPTSGFDAVSVPLPESPNASQTEELPGMAALAVDVGTTEAPILGESEAELRNSESNLDVPSPKTSPLLSLPVHRSPHSAEAEPKPKPMSPEKAALAAMFDSIKMPPPISPTKSSRKTSGSSYLTSPSKQLAREAPPTPLSLFRKRSSPSTSPRKAGSIDAASPRHSRMDSEARGSKNLSHSPSESRVCLADSRALNISPTRVRPSAIASSSSPSAKLSDLSLTLDATATQEFLFHQDTSFLAAAANTAADVTIDDSIDVSRARARISASSASTQRSSPAKVSGYTPKPRCSVVPEESDPVGSKTELGTKSNALGLRGLGIGRVVKNAAGDDTIELNLTGSFIGNSSVAGGNLMDESGEASLLFGNNSFSISHGQLHKETENIAQQKGGRGRARRGSSDGDNDEDEDDEDEDEDNFEQDVQNVQKWAAEAAKKAQLGRQTVVPAPTKPVVPAARTSSSTSTHARASTSASTKQASSRVAAPRPSSSLVTPTASRLLNPHASGVVSIKSESAATPLARSGSASAGLSSFASPVPSGVAAAATPHMEGSEIGGELKTPMRTRRKSTFTSSRPPVSGPARRRESLAAAAVVQAYPLPALPSLGPATPGRVRSVSNTAPVSPTMKTPTAATRTIPKPRASLTGKTTSALPKPHASTAGPGTSVGMGSMPRPRTSLTGIASTATRTPYSSSTASSQTPSARAPTVRSASVTTPTTRTPSLRSSASKVTPSAVGAMRKSASQPHGLDVNGEVSETPTTSTTAAAPRARTLVPRASMSRIGTAAASVTNTAAGTRTSQLVTPRASAVRGAAVAPAVARAEALTERPQNTTVVTPGTVSKVGAVATKRPSMSGRSATSGGFGFKPRSSAVFTGASRLPPSLLDGEDKEN